MPEYQCLVTVGNNNPVITNQLYMSVVSSTSETDLKVVYPTPGLGDYVKCVEDQLCRVTAIFGGV